MSVLTKKRPISKTVQITIENKKRGLFLVPKDKADSIQALIEEYRVRDFVPADLVLSDIHQEYGKLGSVLKGYRIREEMTQVELAKKWIALNLGFLAGKVADDLWEKKVPKN